MHIFHDYSDCFCFNYNEREFKSTHTTVKKNLRKFEFLSNTSNPILLDPAMTEACFNRGLTRFLQGDANLPFLGTRLPFLGMSLPFLGMSLSFLGMSRPFRGVRKPRSCLVN
jgi:hypothetical protein